MPNAADEADALSSFGLVSDVSNLGFRHVQACADHTCFGNAALLPLMSAVRRAWGNVFCGI